MAHIDLELLAVELRRQAGDLSLYSGFLLTVLSAALPPELVTVEREGRWKARLAGREPTVLGVSVRLGDHRYELRRPGVGEAPSAAIRHESAGIVLSSRRVSLDEWAHGLAAALAATAATSEAATAVLRRLTAP